MEADEPEEVVGVKADFKQTGEGAGELTFTMTIAEGWHIYSQTQTGGPIPTTVTIESSEGCEKDGGLMTPKQMARAYDEMFGVEVGTYEGTVVFTQRLKLTGEKYRFSGYLEYGACNSTQCLPPTAVEFSYSGEVEKKKAEPTPVVKPESKPEVKTGAETGAKTEAPKVETPEAGEGDKETTLEGEEGEAGKAGSEGVARDTVETVVKDGATMPGNEAEQAETGTMSMWSVFWLSFVGGLVALLTPCVWPMIPLTVGFFLRRNKSRKKAVVESAFYGLSIVLIFVVVGLVASIVFGANALNSLSTNAVVNVCFFVFLSAFGLSLMAGRDIVLPSSWASRIDQRANTTGGYIGIFLMALTLVVVSFSCTAPVVGLLLAEVSQTGVGASAIVGMVGFSMALAIPFALFAMFPDFMKHLPKSGSWMHTIKVVLGTLELALAFKFLSIADMAYGWHLMSRELFISFWIAIFVVSGLMLLGVIASVEYSKEEGPSVGRLTLGLSSIAFGVSLIPGLIGAPLDSLSAFIPPMSTQEYVVGGTAGEERTETVVGAKTIEEADRKAQAEGKRVLAFFTGYGCVNCRKMEQTLLKDSEVAKLIRERYVMVELFVDDRTSLGETEEVEENGKVRRLRTVGDRHSHDELVLYGQAAQPLFVITEPGERKSVGKTIGFTDSKEEFIQFLKQ